MRLLRRASIISIICTTLSIGFDQPVRAQLISSSGNLMLTWLRSYEQSCATRKPQGSYTVSGGVRGLLYPTDCGRSAGGDSGDYRFADIEGKERCTGSMSIYFGGSVTTVGTAKTTWQIESAVSGYQCSTVGQTYEVTLYRK